MTQEQREAVDRLKAWRAVKLNSAALKAHPYWDDDEWREADAWIACEAAGYNLSRKAGGCDVAVLILPLAA